MQIVHRLQDIYYRFQYKPPKGTRRCKKCGNIILKSDKECLYCGQKQKNLIRNIAIGFTVYCIFSMSSCVLISLIPTSTSEDNNASNSDVVVAEESQIEEKQIQEQETKKDKTEVKQIKEEKTEDSQNKEQDQANKITADINNLNQKTVEEKKEPIEEKTFSVIDKSEK